MELVKISAYALGYNSGAEFNDSIFITKETYEILQDKIEDEMEIWVGDLDGKHSENQCDINIEYFSGEELRDIEITEIEKYVVYDYVNNYCKDKNIDLSTEIEDINDYLKTIDGIEVVEVKIPKSQKGELDKKVSELGGYI